MPAGTKFSQIAPAPAPPSLTDQFLAVQGGANDRLYTFLQMVTAMPLATASSPGFVQPDDVTITVRDGILTAIGGSGSELAIGATTIAGGSAGELLYDSGPGTLEETTGIIFTGSGNLNLTSINALPLSSPASDGGGNSIAIGTDALLSNIGGNYNVALGAGALASNQFGANNVAIGFNALNASEDGSSNFGLGFLALGANVFGNQNVAIGYRALASSLNDSSTIAIGFQALDSISAGGGNNVAVGTSCGSSVTSGENNTLLGCNFAGSATMNGCIVLADGAGTPWLDYNYTTPSVLTAAAPLAVPGGTNPVLTTTSAVTSGAGADLGTLTNAPAAGNPTKWMPFDDAGVTRYFPAW